MKAKMVVAVGRGKDKGWPVLAGPGLIRTHAAGYPHHLRCTIAAYILADANEDRSYLVAVLLRDANLRTVSVTNFMHARSPSPDRVITAYVEEDWCFPTAGDYEFVLFVDGKPCDTWPILACPV